MLQPPFYPFRAHLASPCFLIFSPACHTNIPYVIKISIPQALCAEGIASRTSSSVLR